MSLEDVANAFLHKNISKQQCLGGDGGLSSTVSMYRMAIKYYLVPLGEDF